MGYITVRYGFVVLEQMWTVGYGFVILQWDVEGGLWGVGVGCGCRFVVLKWDVECRVMRHGMGSWFAVEVLRVVAGMGVVGGCGFNVDCGLWV